MIVFKASVASEKIASIFSLRLATLEDEKFIVECFRASTREDRLLKRTTSRLGPYDPAAEKGAVIKMVGGDWQNRGIISVNQDGLPIGFARAYHRQDGSTTLHKLYVAEAHRKQGVARKTVDMFAESAKLVGSHQMTVTLQSRNICEPPSQDMMKFYAKLGFSLLGARQKPSRKKDSPMALYTTLKRDL